MKYFEDLEVGAETNFGSYEVTREEVLEFARKYDPQPFHLSDEAAAKTHFGRHRGERLAHLRDDDGGDRALGGRGASRPGSDRPGIDELRWLKPVYPGDTLHVSGTIVDKTPSRSKPDIGSFRTRTTVTNQDGVPVMTLHVDRADAPAARSKRPALDRLVVIRRAVGAARCGALRSRAAFARARATLLGADAAADDVRRRSRDRARRPAASTVRRCEPVAARAVAVRA